MTDLKKKTHRLFIATAVFIASLIALVLSGCGPQQFKAPIFQMNEYEGWGPNGLTWNGKDMIIGDGSLIVEINSIETGTYVERTSFFTVDYSDSYGSYFLSRDPEPITSPGVTMPRKRTRICGLAWEGECCGKGFLWVADAENREILKLNASNEIIKSLPSPGDDPSGIVFDGKDLWVSDSRESKIYKISPDDGTVLREFNSPVAVPTDLAWDCSNIWVIGLDSCAPVTKNCNTPRLVKLDILSGKVTHEIVLPKQITRPTSMVWVDGLMWIGDYQLGRVFKIPVSAREVKDDTVYATAVTMKPKKIAVQEMPPEAKAAMEQMPQQAVREKGTESRAAADEAKIAAEEAKAAAKEAKEAAKKSQKAFELQQKK